MPNLFTESFFEMKDKSCALRASQPMHIQRILLWSSRFSLVTALRVDKTPLSSDYSLARYLPRDVVQLYSTKHLYINQFRAAGDVFDFCFNES